VEKCPGEWFSGPWGECSKPCGGGERTKKVVCLKDLQVVDADECGPENIIFGREECNTHPCSEGRYCFDNRQTNSVGFV
jgi:hypothetical protein